MGVVLVGGGARSGKSSFAQRYVEKCSQAAVYLATGEARDEEMRDRIARHRADRGKRWRTVEEPLDLTPALARLQESGEAVLVDCLTLWLSNVLLHEARDAEQEIEALQTALAEWTGGTLVVVSNEVGQGIVPENELARAYRDLSGRMNQAVAAVADEVWLVTFGIPQCIRGAA